MRMVRAKLVFQGSIIIPAYGAGIKRRLSISSRIRRDGAFSGCLEKLEFEAHGLFARVEHLKYQRHFRFGG